MNNLLKIICSHCGREGVMPRNSDFLIHSKDNFFCCQQCAQGLDCYCEEDYLLMKAW